MNQSDRFISKLKMSMTDCNASSRRSPPVMTRLSLVVLSGFCALAQANETTPAPVQPAVDQAPFLPLHEMPVTVSVVARSDLPIAAPLAARSDLPVVAPTAVLPDLPIVAPVTTLSDLPIVPPLAPLAEPPVKPVVEPWRADQRYSLKELGAQYPLNLRGVDGSNTLNFSVRNDEVVTGARLNLRYAYSPALLSDLSHINVLVNDEVAASLDVPRETAGRNLEHTVEIPPYLVTSNNDLRLQLVGHYTLDCEDPLHSSLWANISNQSSLELATAPLVLPNNLANLPLPFFDHRDRRRLNLPFVFQGAPDEATLEAAGTLSSWFGALAGYRGASFPASVSKLPTKGNAVVLAVGKSADGLVTTPITGPSVAVITNPNDPNGKLLVVMGRDDKELKQAASALALGSQTLTGAQATITQTAAREPRKPYDAPKWLRGDRPVSFGELLDPKRMNVSGFSPDTIRMDVRVAPDLFGWQEKKVPIDLRYRYTPQPFLNSSSLLIGANDEFIKSLPLVALERLEEGGKLRAEVLPDESIPMRAQVEVPLDNVKPRGQLQFRYMYDYIKQGECRDIILDNVRGMIEPESTIDVSGYPHFIAMPDLRAFSEAGFPFTRMADLSETVVVMGKQPGPAAYTAYLDVMGRMGESTGYPAVGVNVVLGDQMGRYVDKDVLIIATGEDEGLIKNWSAYTPASYGKGARFSVSDLTFSDSGWSHSDPRLNARDARSGLTYDSTGASAIVAGFESPVSPKRSVVLIASNKPDGLKEAVAAIEGGDGYDKPVEGSLSVIRGKQVDALVDAKQYYVGELPLLKRVQWWLSSVLPGYSLAYLVVIALGVLVGLALLIALVRRLRRTRRED